MKERVSVDTRSCCVCRCACLRTKKEAAYRQPICERMNVVSC